MRELALLKFHKTFRFPSFFHNVPAQLLDSFQLFSGYHNNHHISH